MILRKECRGDERWLNQMLLVEKLFVLSKLVRNIFMYKRSIVSLYSSLYKNATVPYLYPR